MRLVVQRISSAQVRVDGAVSGSAGSGLCILVGFKKGDERGAVERLSEKVKRLRIFEDDRGKMNRSLIDCGGEVLVISEFTLYGDCDRGHRPSFTDAAPADEALPLYNQFIESLREAGLRVATGVFGAKMEVTLTNDGPVTVILEA